MEFAEIMDEITGRLTGDYGRDAEYLKQQMDKYRDHEFADAIRRDCRNLMYEHYPTFSGEPPYINQYECRHCGACLANSGSQKYCMRCGRPVADFRTAVIDYRTIPVVYGPPPIQADVTCSSCGAELTFEKGEFGKENNRRYCPKCGALIEVNGFDDTIRKIVEW